MQNTVQWSCKNVRCHMCYMSHFTNFTCHKCQRPHVLHIFGKLMQTPVQWPCKKHHVTCDTCHVQQMLHATNIKLPRMQNPVQWPCKSHLSHVRHVTILQISVNECRGLHWVNVLVLTLRVNCLVWFLSFEKRDQKQKWSLDNFEGRSSKKESKFGHSLLFYFKGSFLSFVFEFRILKIVIKSKNDPWTISKVVPQNKNLNPDAPCGSKSDFWL